MKLLKIISILFLIYFIRRFMQMYRVMKEIQQAQKNAQAQNHQRNSPPKEEAINADFKVMD